MQQKFKIGDKVKVLTKAYPGAYGAEGVVKQVYTKGTHVYVVEQGICDGQMDCMYGHFGNDAWRYCFHESELELVEDMPKTKFKAGDKVVCVRGSKNGTNPEEGKHYTIKYAYFNGGCEYVSLQEDVYLAGWGVDRFELVTDQEVSTPEPDYTIGQEVYVAAGITRNLKHAVLLDAIPRNGLMHVNIGGFDCYVEEERVYTREETKGN